MKRGLLLFAGIVIFAWFWPLAVEAIRQQSVGLGFASAGCLGSGLLLVLGAALRT